MNPPKNDLFLRALRREPVERTPVWLMRQAGRYLAEYRATRAKAGNFLALCKTPELACEVTLQPIDRFGFDAAILFSDILTVPDAMGLGLHFVDNEGPAFHRPLRSEAAIAALPVPDPETELRYVMDAVRTIKTALAGRVPLIGFAGSPWTLATYMIEGSGSRDFVHAKRLRYERPDLLKTLLDKLAEAVSLYLAAQVRAGADALMVFDTWGGTLDPQGFRGFSLASMRQVVERLRQLAPSVPVILFSKGAAAHLGEMAGAGCAALGVDWTASLADARRAVGGRVALQGNLDPAALFAGPEAVRGLVAEVLADYGSGPGHVFNLGHGILQHTPTESVAALVEAVRDLSPAYHRGS
ncbi:MAG: uroporphyrinogen decarboxylase [Nevskia sp.]|nr:uroporphyrinogen decarboxylase [Nevskia sp.]